VSAHDVVADVGFADRVRQMEHHVVRLVDECFAFESILYGQDSGQDLIVDLDQAHRFEGGPFRISSDDRDLVSGIAHLAIEDQAIIGGWFGVGLAGQRETGLGHVLPGQDQFDSWYPCAPCWCRCCVCGHGHGVNAGS